MLLGEYKVHMSKFSDVCEHAAKLLIHQMKNYFIDVNEQEIRSVVPEALGIVETNFKASANSRLNDGVNVRFDTNHSVTWMIFLYTVSHILGEKSSCFQGESTVTADQVYYLNKIMHSNDWYHQIKLPTHFMCEHPLGSVLGRAHYGDYFMIYQGTTVGGNRTNGTLFYPEFGDFVTMYANSTVLGNCKIGNNVIISADTYLINDNVPDNSYVFGVSPNIKVVTKTKEEMIKKIEHIWRVE